MGDPQLEVRVFSALCAAFIRSGWLDEHMLTAFLCIFLIVPVAWAQQFDDEDWQRRIDALELNNGEGWKLATDVVELDQEGRDRQREIDRAIAGDTAVLVEQGELQVTFGTSFEDDGTLETTELFIGIEYGITDWLEVGIAVPYLFLLPRPSDERDVDGVGDVTLSASLGLVARDPFLIAVSLDATLPTGDEQKSLGEGNGVWEPSLVMDVALGDAELVFGVGGEFARHISVFAFEVTLAYPFDEIVPSIGVEGSIDGDEKEVSLVPGIGFPIANNVELSVEVPIGLSDVSPNWQVTIELTFGF